MSGHSKWSKIKHQKAVTDEIKAAAFTRASHAISIAVREGGGITDPDLNFKLRLAIEKAHEDNMPKDNIERIIAKSKGAEENQLEQVTYEAYGPADVALIIEAATDNKQRTVSTIKNILERHGGTLVAPGAVLFMFAQYGVVVISKSSYTMDIVMEHAIEAGANDVYERDTTFEIYSSVQNLSKVKSYFDSRGIKTLGVEIIQKPSVLTPCDSENKEKVKSLIEQLEELEDVQNVYTNVRE